MSDCWQRNPKSRPTFIEIIECLLPEASPKFHEVSYYYRYRSQNLKNKQQRPDDRPPPDASTPLTIDERSDNGDANCDVSTKRVFPMSRTVPVDECDAVTVTPPHDSSFEENDDIDEIDEFSDSYKAKKKLLDDSDASDNMTQLPLVNVVQARNNANRQQHSQPLPIVQPPNRVTFTPAGDHRDLDRSYRESLSRDKENNRSISVQSSDNSKDSKTSNGSIANGHAFNMRTDNTRTTPC